MANTTFYVPSIREVGAWLDWRGKYPGGFGWRGDRPLSSVKKLIIHHTVTNPSGNAEQEANTIYQIHANTKKWGGIGYHFLITTEIVNGFAKVAYVGDIGSIRAHAPDTKGVFSPAGYGNYYFIGISFIGDFTKYPPKPEQLRSAYELVRELIYGEDQRLPLLTDWNCIAGHKETDPTACPGNQWDYKQLQNFAIQSNIIINPELEDPKMIAELQAQIKDLEDKSSAKDTLLQELQKQLQFLKQEDEEFRSSASKEFMAYKNEQDAKYNAIKTNYEKLVSQVGTSDDSSILVQLEQLKTEKAAYQKDAEFWQAKFKNLQDELAKIPENTEGPKVEEIPVQTPKQTVKDLVDKDGQVGGTLEFLKTHSGLILKGSALGVGVPTIIDLIMQLFNLNVPTEWTAETAIGFALSGIALVYGFWIRNHDKIQSLFKKKDTITIERKSEVTNV